MTAPSTRVVAAHLGATTTGPILQDEIAWSVERPVRALKMNTPLVVGNVTVKTPFSRVADFGNSATVRSVDPNDELDGDIVVKAKRPTATGLKLMRVGADDLERCVSLTVDLKARQVTVVC